MRQLDPTRVDVSAHESRSRREAVGEEQIRVRRRTVNPQQTSVPWPATRRCGRGAARVRVRRAERALQPSTSGRARCSGRISAKWVSESEAVELTTR